MAQNTVRPRLQLGDEAASYLRDQITSGVLAPGAHVRPEALAAELGISSTPAREALQGLRAEGFLALAPRRGFTVAQLTGDDIRDVYLAQAWVAGELASRAAKADSSVIDEIEEIHRELTEVAERGDLVALQEQNHLFHRAINHASGAPKLAWLIQLLSHYAPSRFYATIQGWAQATIADHTGIVDALRAGDPDRAREEMRNHVLRAGELLALHVDELRQSEKTSA